MPLYHFNIHDGRSEPDTDGIELPNQASAEVMALQMTGEILKFEARRVALTRRWGMELTDASGNILYRIEIDLGPVEVLDLGTVVDRRFAC